MELEHVVRVVLWECVWIGRSGFEKKGREKRKGKDEDKGRMLSAQSSESIYKDMETAARTERSTKLS